MCRIRAHQSKILIKRIEESKIYLKWGPLEQMVEKQQMRSSLQMIIIHAKWNWRKPKATMLKTICKSHHCRCLLCVKAEANAYLNFKWKQSTWNKNRNEIAAYFCWLKSNKNNNDEQKNGNNLACDRIHLFLTTHDWQTNENLFERIETIVQIYAKWCIVTPILCIRWQIFLNDFVYS